MRVANQGSVAQSFRYVWMVSVLLAACSSSDKEKQEVAKLAETCSINSNCENPLVCAFSHCHEQCAADRDCAAKERCVKNSDGHVCQLTAEISCTVDADCNGSQVCGSVDNECRDKCKTDGDCAGGQLCAKSNECASKDPIKDSLDGDGNILVDDSSSAGTGGSGGAGSGGSGGKAGGAAGGGAAGSGTMSSDPCSAETTPNEDRDHATPFDVGKDVKLCLQNKTDVDFYELKTPTTPAQGGFFVVKLTEVGTAGGVQATAQAAADNGDVQDASGIDGVSVFFWFNAQAGATFRLKVEVYVGGDTAIPYTLRVDFTGVPDGNEPNDVRAMATSIQLSTPIHGYLFAGHVNSTSVADAAWQDWFKATLDGTPTEIALTDVATDIAAELTLYDKDGVELDSKSESSGASVVWTPASAKTATAGDYYIKVDHYVGGLVKGTGSTVPTYLTQPYTLTVTPNSTPTP